MTVAIKMVQFMEQSSWIRKMFEEGTRLKSMYGAGNVFDFSLGNPNLAPPRSVHARLRELLTEPPPQMHAYMPNAGLAEVRSTIANYLSGEHGVDISADNIIMTCGAAGALNVIMKAILDPGDEVVVPAPYFVEYGFYADNHNGILKTVPTRADFSLDLDALDGAVGLKTKIVLINSPNNPTGQIYDSDSLGQLGKLLEHKSNRCGHPIYLVSDEPYRKIVYDGAEVPSIFQHYHNSIIASSYSKDLSIPGERIGYLVVHPNAHDVATLMGALTLANRILGFVNAPALMQRLIQGLIGESVDVHAYQAKRDRLVTELKAAGYELITPPGAFYLFPRSPIADDVAFVRMLQEENILVVPGSGFGGPGHFRIAYCVDDETIERALPGFEQALKKAL